MKRRISFIVAVAALAAAVAAPFVFRGSYAVTLLINIALAAYLGQCWNLMSGYAGQFSFGHAAFYGIGAYTSSLLCVDFGLNPYFGTVAGMIVAALFGLFVGSLSFRYRIRGNFFALVTLAFAEILRVLFHNTASLGGASGVLVPYTGKSAAFSFSDKKIYYFIIFGALAAICFFLARLRRTKTGLCFAAVREDEEAADSLGINVRRYKLLAIALSAGLTAFAGSFYAQYNCFIDPSVVFASTVSVDAIAPCIVGGVGTVAGPLLGALFLTPLREIADMISAKLPHGAGVNMLIYGAILVIFIIFCPDGICGLVRRVASRFSRKKHAPELPGEGEIE